MTACSSTFCNPRMSAVIELRGVGKRYRKLEEDAGLRSALPFAGRRANDLWALRGLNLRIGPGELVGVLGANGAGKTTLLRLLAGVTRPTEGRVNVTGRIAPLISLGVGFHPEMSGRENVLVNGMLLGLSADEVADRFDAIVAFAELEEDIDSPVKFYSSGMTMRLGFSVVVHVNPAILLVDEILAVGDAAFQLKCLDRLRDFQREGAAIVMVSHAIHQIRQLCPRALLVRQGRLVYDGDVETAIALHFESVSTRGEAADEDRVVQVLEQRLLGGEGSHHADYDERVELRARLRFTRRTPAATTVFVVRTAGGDVVTSHTEPLDGGSRGFAAGEETTLSIGFQARLGAGSYRLEAQILSPAGELLGVCAGLVMFVAGRPGSLGVVDLRSQISVGGVDRTDRRVSLLQD